MASKAKLIRIVVKMEDQLSGGMDKAASKVEKVGRRMRNAGVGLTAAVTAPTIAIAAKGIQTFMEYEDVLAELQARTQSTAEEMEAMSKLALKMGADTVFSATDAAQAMLELTSSGSDAAEAMEMLPDILNLAAAGGLDLKTAADGVTDALKIFNMEASEASVVTDALAKAAGSSSATVAEMNEALARGGGVARMYGLDIEETAAALAILAEAGLKGQTAGTNLKSMLTRMGSNVDAVRDAWRDLGVSMYDAQGNMRDIDEVFKDINRAMEGMSMEEQNRISQDLAGSFGILGFDALRAANGISDMQEAMLGASDAATVADARMKTLGGKLKSLAGSWEALMITLGGLSEGPLVGLLDMLIGMVNAMTAFANNNPRLAQLALILVAIAAAFGPLLMVIGQVMMVWPALVAGFTALSGVVAAISGPVLLLVAAFALLFAYLVKFGPGAWQTFKQIGTILQWLEMKIINFVGGALRLLIHGDFSGRMGVNEDSWIVRYLYSIHSGAKRLFDMIANVISAEGIKGKIDALKDELIKLSRDIMVTIGKSMTDGLIEGVNARAAQFVEALHRLAKDAQNAVRNAFRIRSPSKVMMKMGEQVTEGFRRGVDGGGGIGVNVPTAPGMMAAVRPAVASGSGVNINIDTINVPPGTTDEQVETLLRELGKRIRRRGAMGGI
jgi:TP901 family phage tail tape measure protein